MSFWKWLFSLEEIDNEPKEKIEKRVIKEEPTFKAEEIVDPAYRIEQLIALIKSDYILNKIDAESYQSLKKSVLEMIDKAESSENNAGFWEVSMHMPTDEDDEVYWYATCSECGYEYKMASEKDLPQVDKCPNCNVKMEL